MKQLGLCLFLIAAVLTVSSPALAGGRRGVQAAPRLFEPTDHANLGQKDALLFRWGSEGDRSAIQEYQFKLYKGTETIESGLIHAVTLPSSQDRLALPSTLFEDGGTYTWQLRGSGSAKTRPAYTIFKVQKQG